MAGVHVVIMTVFLSLFPARAPADTGLRITEVEQLNTRLYEYTAATGVLSAPTKFRVLLPEGYHDNPDQRYRVLYLLHGGVQSHAWWTDQGDAQEITEGYPVIVVMPDGGGGGWYSDWWNYGLGGPPEWETYHIDQLVPWVDANFRTTGTRAVAGFSMGGFGAMSY